jgi:hypothetical protein
LTPNAIVKQRKQLIDEIDNVKGRRIDQLTPEEMADEITDLKDQIVSLQADVDKLKSQPAQPRSPRAMGRQVLPPFVHTQPNMPYRAQPPNPKLTQK